jgi:hypothetical protein
MMTIGIIPRPADPSVLPCSQEEQDRLKLPFVRARFIAPPIAPLPRGAPMPASHRGRPAHADRPRRSYRHSSSRRRSRPDEPIAVHAHAHPHDEPHTSSGGRT